MIHCARCNTKKPLSEFYQSINLSWCKECRRAYSREKYAGLSPDEKAEASRISELKRADRAWGRRTAYVREIGGTR